MIVFRLIKNLGITPWTLPSYVDPKDVKVLQQFQINLHILELGQLQHPSVAWSCLAYKTEFAELQSSFNLPIGSFHESHTLHVDFDTVEFQFQLFGNNSEGSD